MCYEVMGTNVDVSPNQLKNQEAVLAEWKRKLKGAAARWKEVNK